MTIVAELLLKRLDVLRRSLEAVVVPEVSIISETNALAEADDVDVKAPCEELGVWRAEDEARLGLEVDEAKVDDNTFEDSGAISCSVEVGELMIASEVVVSAAETVTSRVRVTASELVKAC